MGVTRALYASLFAIGIALSLSHSLRAQQAADTVVRVGETTSAVRLPAGTAPKRASG